LIEVPNNLEFIKIAVYDRKNSVYGDRLPLFYGQDIGTGVYCWGGLPNSYSDNDWINVAPGHFSYTYSNMPIPTEFKLLDFAISDSGRMYALYKGETMGPGSLQNIWAIIEVVDRNSEILEDEVVMAVTNGGKLVSYNTNRDLTVEGYRGILYGVPAFNNGGVDPNWQILTNMDRIDVRSTNHDDMLILSSKAVCSGTSYYSYIIQDGQVTKSKAIHRAKLFKTNNGSGLAYCEADGNNRMNRVCFRSTAGRTIDWLDQPTMSSHRQIIDYDVMYQGDLQAAILIEEPGRSSVESPSCGKINYQDVVNLYWNSDCRYAETLKINGNYNTRTRLTLGQDGLYVYHPTSCQKSD
jgi:hypothetical protein